MLSVKMMENGSSGVLSGNEVVGLNSEGSDTNPLRPHAVVDGGKPTVMANHAGRWEVHW